MTEAARRLVRGYWGGYVALLWDVHGQRPWLLRDPSGAWPVVSWRVGELRMIASDPSAAPAAWRPGDQGLDWGVVQDTLARPAAAAARTARRGLQLIAPGDLHEPVCGRATPLWRPAWVRPDLEASVISLATRLREAVEEVGGGMAEDGGRFVVELSGGLDSSIVAGVLGRAGAGCAVNFFIPREGGDERGWAAQAAAAAGLILHTLPKHEAPIRVEDFEELAGGVAPALETLDAQRDRQLAALIARSGAATCFTGQGGDAIFFQMPCARMLQDAWRAGAAPARLGRLSVELAERLETSVWAVWRENLRRGSAAPEARDPFLRAPGPPSGAAHPWLEGLGPHGPARRLQLKALADMQLKFGSSRRGGLADVRHPLLAQPVIEAALEIPPWMQVGGGIDRSLARAAFAGVLPTAILARRMKGALTGFYARRLARSLPELRPYLLDGALAAAGLLDRAAVDRALAPEDLLWSARGLRLLRVLAIEAWVRRWGG